MLRSEEKEKESAKQIDELQRIRLLDNRMRKQNRQSINNQESLRSIKSTDSKKMFPIKNKIIIGQQKSQQLRQDCQSNLKLNMEDSQIRNNRKITDYFTFKLTAKTPEIKNSQKRQKAKKVIIQQNSFNDNYSQSNKFPDSSDPLKDENKALKEKVRLKQQNFIQFKNQIKKQMLDYSINIHKLRKNQMRQKVNHNKVRLGQFYSQKKANDFWVDGIEIRQVKQKLQSITKAKQELQKNKKYQAKKSNKQYIQDPQQWKNSIASQLHFYSREQSHLQQQLKKLQQEKAIHIKQYKLLYDQEHSKYGKIDQITGVCNWPKIDRYQLLGLLGKGGFSQVYKAFDTQELRQVAIKMHQLSPRWQQTVKNNFVKHARREQQVHIMLNHPNIVKHFGTIQIDENAFFQILQYCQGPDLSFYLKKHKRLPQKQAKVIIRNVLSAIKYLHELPQKVIHYDLKPQNILFHQGKIKITDFGLCKTTTTNQQIIQLTSQFVGTYWYLPPQCFVTDQKPFISPKVDIWAIGVIYFQMLYGQKPFGNQMTQARIKNQGIMLKANQVNFPSAPKCTVSNQSKQFIKACLKAQFQDRMDIKQAISHPLFERK